LPKVNDPLLIALFTLNEIVTFVSRLPVNLIEGVPDTVCLDKEALPCMILAK
jgi:hypothetical protein